ncbi:hypothetical protein ACLQ9J_04100 [Bordetella hinzii]|uniref:hypothetical protein n=1 Tax=Bordetella hinzii TaxID=103855 RepID=UPI002A18E37E|nr:hypothetical protein [Bordetella hinzii]WPL79545.1 hypothetical protein SD446_14300 [Bordetella hinzii]
MSVEHDLPARVRAVEKDVGQLRTGQAKIIAWGMGALAMFSLLFGVLGSVMAWSANRTVTQLDDVSKGVATIQTDVAVLKSKQETQDRSWRLIAQLAKKGATDVPKSLSDD